MKVDGSSGPKGTSSTRKAGGKSSASDSQFDSLMGAEETSGAAPTSAAQSIARVDVLLAVQGVEDPREGASKKRMYMRSENILKELDKIRVSMLTGTLTVAQMIHIADTVAAHREKISDPKLAGILDEIDLRAQVELARMRLALDAQKARTTTPQE